MRFVISATLVSVLGSFACSSSSDGGQSSGNGPLDGADSGLGGDGGAGTGASCGDTRCRGTDVCSAAQRCIPAGTCAVDDDCSGDEQCGKASAMCLAQGTCKVSGDCGDGQQCTDGTCAIGGECGQNELSGLRPSPNMLILLDRSGSMDGDAGGDTRWNVAKKAIETVTNSFAGEIRFGLATYSSCLPGGCSAGTIVVPVADANANNVQGFLANKIDQGSDDGAEMDGANVKYLCDSGDPETSTGKSLLALVGEPSLVDATRDNTILLITDGEESGACIDDGQDGPTAAAALLAQTVPVRTYVVGLGVNADSVNQIAVAGGTNAFLPADDETTLTSALSSIASQAISCNLVLDEEPEDASKIYVFFNDEPTPIPRDDADGWSYDAATKTIRFEGASCEALQMRSVTDIDVVFGCAEPVIK